MNVLNIELNKKKTIFFALKSIFGCKNWQITRICNQLNIGKNLIVEYIETDLLIEIGQYIEKGSLQVGNNLKEQQRKDIVRLKVINCYKGLRHKVNLPVRGQRTRTNATSKFKF